MILFSKIKKGVKHPRLAVLYLRERPLYWAVGLYNFFVDLFKRRTVVPLSGLRELDEVWVRSLVRTDLSDHLVTLFVESLSLKPALIVELGVRGGESTFVLERVARLFRSKLVSLDLRDCSHVSAYEGWYFVQGDDITFAKKFEEWCRRRNIHPQIDVLFIDTSHLFEHTQNEITVWFPFLSHKAKVLFHDTNLKRIYFRRDRSVGIGWNNQRGVIAAIERLLNRTFDEKKDVVDFSQGWIIRHFSYCAGFTILEKSGLEISIPLHPIK